jgi:N-acetylneuraminate synthase
MRYRTIIIAEIGVNHNGSIDLAQKLIDAAISTGVDYVKFQTYITELSVTKAAPKAKYQIKDSEINTDSQYDMIKKLELSFNDFRKLKNYCDEKKIGFLSTGFDFPSIDFLADLNQDFIKIPSGEITNKPYLQHIARKGKEVIMSTGMADIHEVKDAIGVMVNEGLKKEQITILHCNTEYPTPMEDVNLKAMLHIKEECGVKVGYSDHTLGIEVPIAAVALGACVIEKHFTLDRTLPGPDHAASLEPMELKAMVVAIRNIEKALSGSGIKETSNSELPNKVVARKSIHLARSLKKDHILQEDDLIMKRPGDGISPMELDKIAGRKIRYDFPEEHKLSWEDLV